MGTAAEIVPEVSVGRRRATREKSAQRSRIANGTQLLPHTDGRSIWARLMRETFDACSSTVAALMWCLRRSA